jgi:hypothetical protein
MDNELKKELRDAIVQIIENRYRRDPMHDRIGPLELVWREPSYRSVRWATPKDGGLKTRKMVIEPNLFPPAIAEDTET